MRVDRAGNIAPFTWGSFLLKRLWVVFLLLTVSMAPGQDAYRGKKIEIMGMISGQLSRHVLPFSGGEFSVFPIPNWGVKLGARYGVDYGDAPWIAGIAGVDYYFDEKNIIYIGCGVLDKIGNDASHLSQSTPYFNAGFKPVLLDSIVFNISYRSYLDFMDKESIFFRYGEEVTIPYGGSLEVGVGIRL